MKCECNFRNKFTDTIMHRAAHGACKLSAQIQNSVKECAIDLDSSSGNITVCVTVIC